MPDAQVAVIVFNTETGKVVAVPPGVAVNCDMWFDAVHKPSILVPELERLYIAVSSRGKTDTTMALQIYEVQG